LKGKHATKQANSTRSFAAAQFLPRPGPAAILAFLDIVLAGYLLFWAAFVVQKADSRFFTNQTALFAIFLPTLLAWRAYFPTDPLTQVLGRVVRVAAMIAIIAVAVGFGHVAFGERLQLPALAFIRAFAVALISACVSAHCFARTFEMMLFDPSPALWWPRRKVPLWLGPLYIFGISLISFLVVAFSYSFLLYGLRGGGNFLARRATGTPVACAVELYALYVAVGSAPLLRWIFTRDSRGSLVAIFPNILVGVCWGWLGASWGWQVLGFELLTYAVGLWLLGIFLLESRSQGRGKSLDRSFELE
jgi:hypothetical protein